MANSTPHVLILGAGLGGLTLAQTLRKQGVSFEIFDRDLGLNTRFQGWAISMHGLFDEMAELFPDDMPPLFESVNHLSPLNHLKAELAYHSPDSDYKFGVRDDGKGSVFVRANRPRLRTWLATGIEVQCNKKAVQIEETEGPMVVRFADGSSATGDIVVGADGTHSIARKYLLRNSSKKDPLEYEPQSFIAANVTLSGDDFASQIALGASASIVSFLDPDADDDSEDLNSPTTTKICTTFSAIDSVSADGKSAHCYVQFVQRDPTAACRGNYWASTATGEVLRDHLMRKTRNLAPRYRRILEVSQPEDYVRPPLRLATLILRPDEVPKGRVTMLGDAAHAMVPFQGQGGHHAMKDGLNLGQALGKIQDEILAAGTTITAAATTATITKHLAEYQEEMLIRGAGAAQRSAAASYTKADLEATKRWNSGHETWPLDDQRL